MRILITGGAGFIGSHLAEKLVALNHELTIYDNFENGNEENIKAIKGKVTVVTGDIRDKKAVAETVKNKDVIYHLAAKVTVNDSFSAQSEYEAVNISGTKNLLDAAVQFGCKTFIFASSAAVYGNTSNLPICELNTNPSPISPLGKTKLEAEMLCKNARDKGLSVIIFRFFNVYGARQNTEYNNVITQFITTAQQQQAGIIFGDGQQTRDFIHVNDIVQACSKAGEEVLINGVFNIGSGIPTSINSLYQIIQQTNHKGIIPPIYKKSLNGDIMNSYACICQAKKQLGFNPAKSLQEGLQETIKWYLKAK